MSDGSSPASAADERQRAADAAWWLGQVDESTRQGELAYREFRAQGQIREAALAAIGVAVNFLLRGNDAVGSGWLGQAERLLADQPESPEHGYLSYLTDVEGALDSPDMDAVIAAARRVRAIGDRHRDPTLIAVGVLGEGRVRLRQGRVSEGMSLLDSAMVAVLSERLPPEWAGNIYCHMMAACHELGDVRRAHQWVDATSAWLDTLPAAVLFTGICRVHRSQVLQMSGQWVAAEQEAARVCADLIDISRVTVAEGYYQVAEMCRLRGNLADADQNYQQAHALGRDPQPGLALLRSAQGRHDAALASIRAALIAERANRLRRARLLTAGVEIALAGKDLQLAGELADELAEIASTSSSPGFAVAANRASGALLCARGRPGEALPVLLAARRGWQELDAPYDTARVRQLLAQAYRDLGDADSAELELAAAAEVFEHLGARRDAEAVAAMRGTPALPGGLTEREIEVLSCLAVGRTNRQIATTLSISDKTVARHLSNIFTKLGVNSRTAASAYAHRHGLVS